MTSGKKIFPALKRTGLVLLLLLFSVSALSAGPLSGLFGKKKTLDEKTIISGLKEALEIGTKNAVKKLAAKNGYFKNDKVFIPLPDDLRDLDKALRRIGMGRDMDKFIEDMNHAAEQAANKAADIFIKALKEMTLSDAKKILEGNDTAATAYFENKTRDELYRLFFPVIKKTLNDLGVTKLYKSLLKSYNKIPLVKKKDYDIDEYATNKALDGLFYMVGEEEKKIRKNPAARVTDLLKKVFG